MKYKKILSVVLAFVLLFSLSSCKSAPVKTNGIEDSEDVAAETVQSEPADTGKDTAEDEAEQETEQETEQEIPLEEGQERLTTSFTSEDGAISYNIDAVVSGTDITSLPTFTVTPAIYTAEELEQITRALAGDSVVYAYSETVARPVLEEMLIEKKAYISDRDALMEYYRNDENVVNRRIEEVSTEITAIEEDLPYAPEEVPKLEPEYVYKPDVEYDEGNPHVFAPYYVNSTTFRALTDVDGVSRQIMISYSDNSRFGSEVWLNEDLRIGSTYQQTRWNCYQTEPFTEIDIEAAKEDVMNTLREMGFDNWAIETCEVHDIDLDEFYEGKDTEGLPVTSGVRYQLYMVLEQQFVEPVSFYYTGEKDIENYFNKGYYANPYRTTSIRLYYSNGKIIYFYGENLHKIESESNSQQLLAYEEAMNIITDTLVDVWDNEMINQHYTRMTGAITDDRVVLSGDVTVDSIELVYVRISIDGDEDSYQLVPAWAVFGKAVLTEYKIGNTHVMPPEVHDNGLIMPILLIDAIDGSVISLS
ncbi:MAG: hypothetical protein IJ017_07475 [Oscillospiraceae bacterium]|nr:hypothetical protein [Oscillospiraceae bacterium]